MEIIRHLSVARVIARGRGIRELRRLRKAYPGSRNWRKKSIEAEVDLGGGVVVIAEIHWYEGHGIGPVEHKIKRML